MSHPFNSLFMKRRNSPRCIGTELSWLNMDRGIARLEVATKSFSFLSSMVSRRENPDLSFPVLCLILSANRSTAVWLVSQSLATDRFWSRTTRRTLFGAFLMIRNPRPLFPDGKYCSCTSSGRNSDRCREIRFPPSISRCDRCRKKSGLARNSTRTALARPQKQRKIQRAALIQRRDLELFELAVRHFVGPGA